MTTLDAHRRELAHLPGVLRPAHRHGHRVGPGHQRGVRVHVDAGQPAARPPTRPPGRGRSTAPSRPSATRRSTPTRPTGPRRPTSCASRWAWCARWSRCCASRCSSWPGFEADDIIATLATEAAGPRRRRPHRHRRPRQLPAGRGPPRQGALQPAGGLRLRPLRRGRHRRTHRGHARRSTSSTPRCAAIPPTTCPACPGWGRRRRPSSSPPTAASTASSTNLEDQTPKLRQNLAEHEAQVRPNAELMVLRARRPARRRPRRARASASFDLDEVRQLFDFLEFRTLYDRLLEALGAVDESAPVDAGPGGDVLEAERTDLGRPGRGGRAACGPWPRATSPLAVAAAWAGRRRPLAARGSGPGHRRRGRRGRVDPGGHARRPRRRTPRSPRWSAPAGRPLVAHDAKALMRSLDELDVDVRVPRARHHDRRLPARPGRGPLRPRRAARPLRRRPAARPTTAPPRASSTSAATASTWASRRPAGRWPSTGWSTPLHRRARRPGPARRSTTRSRSRSSGCSPAWRSSAWASTSPSCAASATSWSPECDELAAPRSARTPARSST